MTRCVADNVLDACFIAEYSSGEYLRHAMMSKEAKMELMSRILGQHSQNTDAVRVLSKLELSLLTCVLITLLPVIAPPGQL